MFEKLLSFQTSSDESDIAATGVFNLIDGWIEKLFYNIGSLTLCPTAQQILWTTKILQQKRCRQAQLNLLQSPILPMRLSLR